ncbi:MAG TPA: hypothetical protein VF786_02845 [Terriglobales bacterium]
MRRLLTLVLLTSAVAFAQVASHDAGDAQQGNPHGFKKSSRMQFAAECGINSPDPARAVVLSRSEKGAWKKVSRAVPPGQGDNSQVRAWRETNTMIEWHESPNGTSMHTAQFCYRPDGSLWRLIDRFVEPITCRCARMMEATFNADGSVRERHEGYYDMLRQQPIAEPAQAKSFPAVYEIKKLDQLPFAEFLKSND